MNTSKTFYLNPAVCKAVHGAKGAAIYDFSKGEVIALPPDLALCIDVTALIIELPQALPSDLHKIITGIEARDLGQYEPYSQTAPLILNPPATQRDFAWLELTEQCNLKCHHCYGSCTSDPPSINPLSAKEWIDILGQIRANGFEKVQFIGGEPLLNPDFISLLYTAKELGLSYIEVFSNLLLMDEETLNAIKACNAHLATTLYAANSAIHDKITGFDGSFAKTTSAIKQATQRKIPTRVSCIVTDFNEGKTGALKDLCDTLGVHFRGENLLRPTGRGTGSTCRSTIPRHRVGQPFYTTAKNFAEAQYFNTCWKGKIAITDTGNVLPCVFSREHIAGNLRTQTLQSIIDSPAGLGKFWSLTKDLVETCSDCEFRYACNDCRPLASGRDNDNLHAKTYGCPYDPYTGTWK